MLYCNVKNLKYISDSEYEEREAESVILQKMIYRFMQTLGYKNGS